MWEKKYISHWWTFSPISTSHWWTYANCWSAAGGGEGRLWVYEKDRGEEVAAWEREEIWERCERDQMRCYSLRYLSAWLHWSRRQNLITVIILNFEDNTHVCSIAHCSVASTDSVVMNTLQKLVIIRVTVTGEGGNSLIRCLNPLCWRSPFPSWVLTRQYTGQCLQLSRQQCVSLSVLLVSLPLLSSVYNVSPTLEAVSVFSMQCTEQTINILLSQCLSTKQC